MVGEPLALTVTAPATVPEGSPATLVAHTSGARPVSVAWYQGSNYLGIAHQLTLELPRGTHRIRAEAWSDCGTIVREVEIIVGQSRRRAASH